MAHFIIVYLNKIRMPVQASLVNIVTQITAFPAAEQPGN
jgi:hypothetical protein